MPVTSLQDPFGLGRLEQSIRQNRQEKRQSQIDSQNAITRDLQQRGLELGIEGQERQVANQAQIEKNKSDLQLEFDKPENKGKDRDFVTLNFLKDRNPAGHKKLFGEILSQADQVKKLAGGKAGIDFMNKKTGSNMKFISEDENTTTLDLGTKKIIVNDATGEVIKEFDVKEKPKPIEATKFQLKEGTDAEGNPIFFKFDSKTGIVPEGVRPSLESGETIEVTPEGTKITRGILSKPKSIQQQKFEEKQKESKIKAEKRTNQAISKTDIVLTKVNEALENIGLLTTGIGGAVSGVIPGTQARDLQGSIDTIKANLAFQALQDMREASPTGGALGAVSERELNLLESTITSLDRSQSPERVRENLTQIKDLFEKTKKNLDVAESFRRKGLDPNNLTEEQLRTQTETGVKIVIPNHPTHGDVTEADIKKTMEDTGLSEKEVLQALGAK